MPAGCTQRSKRAAEIDSGYPRRGSKLAGRGITMTLYIAGLGPGSADLVTGAVLKVLNGTTPVILRTRHHPTVAELGLAAAHDCDDLYSQGADFDAVYREIAERVLAAASDGDMVYAVPGNPLVAEQSVELILAAAAERGIAVRLLPGLSYVDCAAVALRTDLGNVQLCDALRLRIDSQRPALVSQLHDRDTLSELKLALLDIYPADHEVTLLRELGAEGEQTRTSTLAQLDHHAAGYLDALFIPPLAPIDDVRRFDGLAYIIERLHAPDGCPWDREQTHESLRHHLLEEAYEALDAIDRGDPSSIAEELGDVLLQVLMHGAVGEREGTFTFGDIAEHITLKLVRRHPHVFGDVQASSAEEVYQNWEALKQVERPEGSILDGVPRTLPALAASQSIQGRARRVGFDWPDIEGPLDKLVEEVREFAHAATAGEREEEFGDILFVLANIGERLGIDTEQALRGANDKFRSRFGYIETTARERQIELTSMNLQELDVLWNEAKAAGHEK